MRNKITQSRIQIDFYLRGRMAHASSATLSASVIGLSLKEGGATSQNIGPLVADNDLLLCKSAFGSSTPARVTFNMFFHSKVT